MNHTSLSIVLQPAHVLCIK